MTYGIDFFSLVLFVASVLFTLYAVARFLRWRSGYNFGLLVIFLALSAMLATDLVAPEKLTSMQVEILKLATGGRGGQTTGMIVMNAVLGTLILAYLLYPKGKGFIRSRKSKGK